jgi:hypothetical protein
MEHRPVMAMYYLLAASVSRITTIAADSDQIDLSEIHDEFEHLLTKYRIGIN